MHALKVIEARSAESLLAHHDSWEALAAAAVEPNAFYEPSLLLPAYRTLGAAADIEVLLLFLADEPTTLCGLFPLHRRRMAGVPGLTVAQLWKHRQGFFCAPLMRPGFESACWHAVFEWLRSAPRGAGMLELTWFPGEGPVHQGLIDYLVATKRPQFIREQTTRAVLRRGQSAEQYMGASLSSSRRKKLRKLDRELRTLGRLEFQALEPGDDLSAWVSRFLALEASGWKGRAGTALACCAEDRTFFMEAAAAAFARGRLRMLAAELDGRPIAMQCDFLAADGGFSYKVAFDESFARYSPGFLLEMENIRRLHDDSRLSWLDSCNAAGPSPLKDLWQDERVIVDLIAGTGRAPGDWVVSLLPLARSAKRSMKALWRALRRPPRLLETHDRPSPAATPDHATSSSAIPSELAASGKSSLATTRRGA